ncbi:class I SAM-dependent methyltransferase [Erythrobacter aquimaris]|uniref:Class I SAM-dependent methyltransferase n=2 Tax=Qipengyuania aquimaris TaxID=255984 RepID=A0A6I4TL87_9SPHN|nr:class I SAM-dependent methyltransferase [Qipengyuania aquimaris]
MPVSRYMGESNARYYTSRDPLGASGDFTTAPEISQMFGEMIGLWLTDLWARAGKPDCAYVELGPGRGTLATDALRAMASQGLKPAVHLVEGSEALRDVQAGALGGATFHDTIDTLPEDLPLLAVGNEFLDALPIRQLVMTEKGWRERMVALDEDAFVFAAGPSPMDDAVPDAMKDQAVGTVIEACPAAAALAQTLADRLKRQGGAALLIDYGHLQPRTGETLQAIKAHRKVGVFDAPGDMDLTAHVDFAILSQIASGKGLNHASTTQGQWLGALGMGARAQALVTKTPEGAPQIAQAFERLTGADEMGELFKVFAMTPPDWPEGAGFG